ncbi:MAG TPA: YihY/virulence factor BrkB family protein [Solirubrobacteraceae bacterium]|nr:YihY/virulence factor BrkB family protein [Solirubrobacteraceae bacterium]
MKLTESLDEAQKSHRRLSIAVATFKKFSDDKASNLATMIAFWAFFGIFPLLLVLVTLLGWILSGSDKASVLGHIANLFPLLDPKTVTGLSGSWWAIVLGLLTALWSGLGVVRTVQFAFDTTWGVPDEERPGTVKQVLRSLWILATIGLGLVLTTFISGFVVSASNGVHLGALGRIGGYVLAVALNLGLFLAAFMILITRKVTVREVLPGAVFAGLVFFVLQQLSAFIISSHLKNAQSTYGHFATVITILWWFYLQAQVTLLGSELNVVLADKLYPRSLVSNKKRPESACPAGEAA